MSSPDQPAGSPAAPRRTVLVVEDEELLRAVLCRHLVHAGYEAVEARHGRDALKLLKAGRAVDLVLTDMIMPLMDGAELVLEIRRRWPELHIVAMSACTPAELFRFGIPHVDGPFLQKPFTSQDLIAAVARALGNGA
jgi:two-component system, cell cycle sensor histidine kinase and response regulator CckA